MRGKCLGGSEPDGAGRVLEAHCPDENTGAQGRTVWVGGGSLGESGLVFCRPSPDLHPSPPEPGWPPIGCRGQAAAGTGPVSWCQRRLSREFTAAGNICSVSHHGTGCFPAPPALSALSTAFLSSLPSLFFLPPLYSLGLSELVISAPSIGLVPAPPGPRTQGEV